jgi:acetyltransferase-like isoleucine patch superfamily enzyme
MKKALIRLFNFFYYRYLIFINPAFFAKKVGVNLKGSLFIYGASPGMFGSEPWLISMGDNVHIAGGVSFVNHDGGVLILRHKYPSLEITKPIEIKDNVYIGMNSIIMPGVKIGNNVIIGAGSVVNKDIPDNSVFAGVPAKFIKSIDDYLVKCKKDSLGMGHLSREEKAIELKKFFLEK